MLVARNIDKSFPGVHALNDVSIEVYPHEVVGLVGENGAGKSTLMRILAGVYQPDSGELSIDGEPVKLSNARTANSYGIGMVFQEQSLLPNISVGENIYLGHEDEFMRFGVINWRALFASARRQLVKVESSVDPARRTDELSFAERQMVELAKVLTLEERVHRHLIILLDEPTSVLEKAEIKILFDRVRNLRQRASFIFCSHRLDEVLEISDRVYVMKDGQVVSQLKAADASVPELHKLMVGRGLQAEYYREGRQKPYDPEVVLSVKDLSREGDYHNVSFELHKGEILGIAGVIGSGREQVCRTLFGFVAPTSGEIQVNGRPAHFRSPSDAVAAGIGYIPQERRTEGLVLFLPVLHNMSLADIRRVLRRGVIDHESERGMASKWIKTLNIRTPSANAMCLNLSGGNQQKVVLAKWMNAESKILILDHPTRGLDVGAKEEVYELVRNLTDQGISVIVIADTLEETIGLSHTILVMKDGVVTQRFDAPPGHKPEQLDLIGYMV
ncbi:MAG: sugar ABC transporter ATP-binding protein [Anaerolineae bacterium]|nr:sugar ABC transporter ATP-binding protein [Anaerolineae bacterium]